ncbi:MAG TPA: DUF1732 domain-containing protein, partial [Saprospiraceae bacterium]|nr:DUF1732 domain-containing protein [Saprospiraceae bacterium]
MTLLTKLKTIFAIHKFKYMLYSMTGFGNARSSFGEKTITVEIRSVNSKFTEIRYKLPLNYRDKESEIRKLLNDDLNRGKIEFGLTIRQNDIETESRINTALFTKYFQELSSLSKNLNIDTGDIMQTIMRIPNVIFTDEVNVDESEWQAVSEVIKEAIISFNKFRQDEGEAMERDLRLRINSISELLIEIDPHEIIRMTSFKERLKKLLEDNIPSEVIDNARFEQEVLYYLEKLDINEEKVRLTQHCKYFLDELDSSDVQKGRKL